MTKEKGDKAVPNYEIPCQNCGHVPTVQVVDIQTEKINFETELCGACCWGEADCLDPDNW